MASFILINSNCVKSSNKTNCNLTSIIFLSFCTKKWKNYNDNLMKPNKKNNITKFKSHYSVGETIISYNVLSLPSRRRNAFNLHHAKSIS